MNPNKGLGGKAPNPNKGLGGKAPSPDKGVNKGKASVNVRKSSHAAA